MWKFMGGKRYVVHAAVLLSALFLSQTVLAGGTGTGTATFKAELLQSGCTVSFLNESGALIQNLKLGDIRSADMPGPTFANSIANPAKPLKLKLTGCGLARTGKMPAVKLKGQEASSADIPVGHGLGFKFRRPGADGGTSHYYFVVVGEGSSLFYTGRNGSNGLYKVDDVITMGNSGVTGEGLEKDLYVSVACDDLCAAPDTRAGTLYANLIFDFLYQ